VQTIDFYYDFISPYSYLAVTQLPALAERNAVEINWTPVNLPSLIKRSGNIPPGTIPKKAIYLLRDLKRWAAYLDVPLKMITPGAFDARPALNIASALTPEQRAGFSQSAFDTIWSGQINVREADWLEQLFDLNGYPKEWLALAGDKTSPALEAQTKQALDAGAFGAPTFVLRGKGKPQMFWGVDRMDFLQRAIQKSP